MDRLSLLIVWRSSNGRRRGPDGHQINQKSRRGDPSVKRPATM
jgi:hypothetical protein